MEKTFTIVGISTFGKLTKFRVANGDLKARQKVLERAGHTDIQLVQLTTPMTKLDAIIFYKTLNPESMNVRAPNEKPAKSTGTKTVNLNKTATKSVADAASELLEAVER